MRTTPRIAIAGLALSAALAALADATTLAPEHQEKDYKLTVAVYRAAGDTSYDANLRGKFGDFVAWVGGYDDPRGGDQARVGADYDLERLRALVVPSLQLASNGFVQGAVYAELGGRTHAIVGYSRTNLKPYFTLAFDPNDSVQLGAGRVTRHGGRIDVFTIADIRLGTAQQDTHLFWRRMIPHANRITVDLVYKSGHTDDGEFVRGMGVTGTFDRPRWFIRAAYDPHVNFTPDTMVRLGGGWRF